MKKWKKQPITPPTPSTGDGKKKWVAGIDAAVVGEDRRGWESSSSRRSTGLLLEINAMCGGEGENRGEVVTARYAAKEINGGGRVVG
ncbi:hypothetical protein Pyn_14850 [Prunus yedoensis var. nudiflora]|uniref:Uncharacterized protein n=1 Tax=Prunus yedoensis var. nudiflora TaxID=2094558 RepID=A0A314YZH6_PRUYE|nr:hypothetical protein Pyn_14850 [Prunus yedoensis var. nudiflora]